MKYDQIVLPLFLCLFGSPHLKAVERHKTSVNIDTETSDQVFNKAVPKKVFKQVNVTTYEQLVPATSYQKYTSVQPLSLLKAGRLKFNIGADIVQNERYYSSYGALLGVQYFIDETWGLGLAGTAYSSTGSPQTASLKDVQAVNTAEISGLKNKLQVDLYFVPFYGKWSFGGKTILPFELYLKSGVCQVTNQFSENSSGYDFGLGQNVTLNENRSIDVGVQLTSFRETTNWTQSRLKNSISFLISYSFYLTEIKVIK